MDVFSNGGTFYSNHLSGAFRLKNGNTLATEGTSGRISEIDNNGNIIFQYTHQGGGSNMAKAVPYEKDYEGILDLTSGFSTQEGQVFTYIQTRQIISFIFQQMRKANLKL